MRCGARPWTTGWRGRNPRCASQGAIVKKGDVVLEIDSRAAKLKLAELAAQVNELRAQRATLAAEWFDYRAYLPWPEGDLDGDAARLVGG